MKKTRTMTISVGKWNSQNKQPNRNECKEALKTAKIQ